MKEHFADNFARRFQEVGISALLYDHRGWGSSEGLPKNQTSPLQQAEDYHDAVTFVASLQPAVNPSRIGIWGIGHSGGASMIAGNDPRLSVVVLVMPMTSGALDAKGFPEGVLENAWNDREDTTRALTSGKSHSPGYVPIWPDSLEQAKGRGRQTMISGEQAFDFITKARERSDKAGNAFVNKLSLQSFYHLSNVEPSGFIHKISPRRLLYLAAVQDPLSGPLENQRRVFEMAGEPKEFVVLNDHHIANYFGLSFEENVGKQIEFLKKYL